MCAKFEALGGSNGDTGNQCQEGDQEAMLQSLHCDLVDGGLYFCFCFELNEKL
jgi:hypothetical protein